MKCNEIILKCIKFDIYIGNNGCNPLELMDPVRHKKFRRNNKKTRINKKRAS